MILGLHAYLVSRQLADQDLPFDALIAAAMRRADTDNLRALQLAFPEHWAELERRYHAPGGMLPEDGGRDE